MGVHTTKPDWFDSHVILCTTVGSEAHGVTQGDDHDEMAVIIEPPYHALGMNEFDTYMYRTAWERTGTSVSSVNQPRSQQGDIDYTAYSLRKYVKLMLNGNPSIIVPLYTPPDLTFIETPFGKRLREFGVANVRNKLTIKKFLGYSNGQKQALLHEKNKKVKRPELEERYGFDCYSDDTEFLTEHGWRYYDEITDNDRLATVNQRTHAIEYEHFFDRVKKPYTGKMYHFTTKHSDCLVTGNHRMWVSPIYNRPKNGFRFKQELENWQIVTAQELVEGSKSDYHYRTAPKPTLNSDYQISDEEIILYGAFVTEGCVGKRLLDGTASVLRISQQKSGRLIPFLRKLEAKYQGRWFSYEKEEILTIANRDLAAQIVQDCGNSSYTKRLPSWVSELSEGQSNLLLEVLMAGDGSYYPNRRIYYTQSPELAGDVQALALRTGHAATVMGPYEDGFMYHVYISNEETVKSIRTRESSNGNVELVDVEDKYIVCFSVPNEILITRRNGKVAIQGNTKYAYHMVRLTMQGLELLRHGRVPLPVRMEHFTILKGIRQGDYTLEECLEWRDIYATKIETELEKADIPERPDINKGSQFLSAMYLDFWEQNGY